jgi:peptidyl-tRNA hydrolase, PTH1 family
VKLIVGLGNPGYEYAQTPHNLGFMAVDRLAEISGVAVARRESQALVASTELERETLVLAKPQTFVNLSGMAVANLLRRLELDPASLIVLVDDVNLPLDMVRIRLRGSAGGHNGLKSVIGALGSEQFLRVRIGAAPERPIEDLVSYVLRPFARRDLGRVAEAVDQAVEAVRMILKEGPQKAMNGFNRRAPADEL